MDDLAGRLLQGTCGWSDASLVRCGRVFPSGVKNGEDKLRFLSHNHFGVMEVDSTCYAIPPPGKNHIPPPERVQGWCSATPDNFTFAFKAFGLFCSRSVSSAMLPLHIRNRLGAGGNAGGGGGGGGGGASGHVSKTQLEAAGLWSECWDLFNAALLPAAAQRKLRCVVFQFHVGFVPAATPPNHSAGESTPAAPPLLTVSDSTSKACSTGGDSSLAYILHCRRMLDSRFAMAVELRDRAWFDEFDEEAGAPAAAAATASSGSTTTSQLSRTLLFLRAHNIVLVASDDLQHEVAQRDRDQVRTIIPSSSLSALRLTRRP
jgi:uncharacterized protein YecE (DUF72 family)